jgi:hypothetical protein
MASTKHIIGRQEFQIIISREKDASFVHEKVADIAKHTLSRFISEIFDRYADPDVTTQYERVTIDLGRVTKANFEQKLLIEVQKSLEQLLEDASIPPIPRDEYLLEAVHHFLVKGYLPWWVLQTDSPLLIQFTTELLEHHRPAFGSLLKKISTSEPVKKRILQQYPATFIFRFLELMYPRLLKKEKSWIQRLSDQWRQSVSLAVEKIEEAIHQTLFNHLLEKKGRLKKSEYLASLVAVLSPQTGLSSSTLTQSLIQAGFKMPLQKTGAEASEKETYWEWKHFLTRGEFLPFGPFLQLADLSKWLADKAYDKDPQLKSILQTIPSSSIAKKATDQLTMEGLKGLVYFFFPKSYRQMGRQLQDWQRLLEPLEIEQLPPPLTERYFWSMMLREGSPTGDQLHYAESFLQLLAVKASRPLPELTELLLAVYQTLDRSDLKSSVVSLPEKITPTPKRQLSTKGYPSEAGITQLLSFLRTGRFQPGQAYPSWQHLELELRWWIKDRSIVLSRNLKDLWKAGGFHAGALQQLESDLLKGIVEKVWREGMQKMIELRDAVSALPRLSKADAERMVFEEILLIGGKTTSGRDRLYRLIQQVLNRQNELVQSPPSRFLLTLEERLPQSWKPILEHFDGKKGKQEVSKGDDEKAKIIRFLKTGVFETSRAFPKFSDLIRYLRRLVKDQPSALEELFVPLLETDDLSPKALDYIPRPLLEESTLRLGEDAGKKIKSLQASPKVKPPEHPWSEDTYLELIRSYLRYGWWSEEPKDEFYLRLNKALLWLAERNSSELIELLLSELNSPQRQADYLQHLSLNTQEAMLELLAREQWSYFKGMLRDLQIIHWDLPWEKFDRLEAESAAYRLVIQFLFQQTRFSPELFLEEWIIQLGSMTDLKDDQHQLWKDLQQTTKSLREQNLLTSDIVNFILIREFDAIIDQTSDAQKEEEERSLVQTFLTKGTINEEEKEWSPKKVQQTLTKWMSTNLLSARTFLRTIGAQSGVADRMVAHFDPKEIDKLIKGMTLGAFPRLVELLDKWRQQTEKTDPSVIEQNMLKLLRKHFLLLVFSESFAAIRPKDALSSIIRRIAREENQDLPLLLSRMAPLIEAEEYSSLLSEAMEVLKQSLDAEQKKKLQEELTKQVSEFSAQTNVRSYLIRVIDHLSAAPPGRDELPWQEMKEDILTDFFQQLERLTNEKAVDVIRTIWNQPPLFNRFLSALTEVQLQQVRQQITGVYTDLVEAYAGLVIQWDQDNEEELSTGEIEYEVFRYFLEEEEIETIEFVKILTFRLAQKTSASLPTLAHRLLALSKEKVQESGIRFFRLAEILEDLDWDIVFAKLIGERFEAETTDPDSIGEGIVKETSGPEWLDKKQESEEFLPVPNQADQFQQEMKALHYFLLYGTFRPGHPRLSVSKWEERQQQWMDEQPEIMAQFYRQVLSAPSASSRVLNYFSETLIMEIISVLAPGQLEPLTSLWADLKLWIDLREQKKGRVESIKDYYATILLFLGKRGPSGFQLDAYFNDLLQYLSRQLGLSFEALLLEIREGAQKGEPQFSTVTLRLMSALANRRQAERTIRTAMAQKGSSKQKTMSEIPMEESIFIKNSGLVILAPFLPRFFGMVNLTKEKAFVDEAAAIRGALLLHYMVTGETEGPEYEMVLNKILCGLPIHMPLPATLDISEEEKEVVASMLMGVKTNWSKMENSTVEAMVESFVQREGRLSEESDHWELVVESKAFDILIEFLPWTIGMVKLPWMEKRIEVTWKTKL